MPSPRPVITYMPPKPKPGKGIAWTTDSSGKQITSGPMSIKQAAKIKEQKKVAQAKVDTKTATAAAKNPKSVSSNVKVVPSMTAAERAQRNIGESYRLHNISFGTGDIRAHAERNVTKGPTISIRTNPGITGSGAANVAKLYKGGGMGIFGLPKNK